MGFWKGPSRYHNMANDDDVHMHNISFNASLDFQPKVLDTPARHYVDHVLWDLHVVFCLFPRC